MKLKATLKLAVLNVVIFLKNSRFSRVLVTNLEKQFRQYRFKRSCRQTYVRISSVLQGSTLDSLKINLNNSQISEVIPESIPGYWQLNPTIFGLNKKIYLCWRATNGVFSPVADKLGRLKLEKSTPQIRNQILVGELNDDLKIISQRKIHDSIGVPSFEDPRGFDSQDCRFVVGTVITEEPMQGSGKWRSSVGFLDISTGEIKTISNPKGKQIEKNWVPIKLSESSIKLLYSTNPHAVVEIDPISLDASHKSKSLEAWVPNVNGGSQFVRLPNGDFLRVGRKRFPVERKGLIHFSYILLYDANLKLLRISRPFIFQKIGFEICNGLMLKGDGWLYFTWGEDDRRLYIMKVTLTEVLSWLYANENQKFEIIKNRKNYYSARKLLMS